MRIFMYHSIVSETATVPSQREVGADIYDVTADDFRSHMEWLTTSGYIVTSVEDRHAEDSSVVVTFDDGELNNYEEAYPVLKDLGMSAYFFVIVSRVGKPGYMNWDQLKEMHDNGMIIGSHGLSHEILTNLLDTQIEEELLASRKTIENNLGIKVDSFSVPRGFCNDKIIHFARTAGYKNIFISERPKDLTVRCYDRIPVKKGWGLKRFEAQINDDIPVVESVFEAFKNIFKRILPESFYNGLRSMVIKVFK